MQDYSSVEIIVVDDGSNDATESILSDYISKKKIIYIKKINGGPASARNMGIIHAKGKYIALLDADDIWEKNKLKKQLDFLIKKNFDLTYTDRFIINKKDDPQKADYSNNIVELIRRNYIVNSSVLAKTEIFKENHFDEELKLFAVEDYDLWLRLAFKNKKIGYLPQKLTGYRIHKKQISSVKDKNIDNLIYLYKKNLKIAPRNIYRFLIVYRYIKISIYKYLIKIKCQ
jgi:glycosyltransferase involved in cell wall biosynthesis